MLPRKGSRRFQTPSTRRRVLRVPASQHRRYPPVPRRRIRPRDLLRQGQTLRPLRRHPHRGERGDGRRWPRTAWTSSAARTTASPSAFASWPGSGWPRRATAERSWGRRTLPRLQERLREALDHAYERAVANASGKEDSRSRLGVLGEALYDMALAPVEGAAGHRRTAVRDRSQARCPWRTP